MDRIILCLLMLCLLTAGCGKKEEAPLPAEGELPVVVVELNDPVLVEFNKLLNKWEVAQNQGDKRERDYYHELESWSDMHYDHLVAVCGMGSDMEILVAAPALGFSHREDAIQILLRLTDHPNTDVVANACLGLGVLGITTTPIEPFVNLLQHPDPNVRSKAAFVLTHICSRGDSRGSLNPLIAALKDPEIWVQVNALNALGVIGDKRAVVPILKNSIYHSDGRVRYAAVSAIGHISYLGTLVDIPEEGVASDSPIPYLIELLDDENGHIKKAAHWALRRITHEEIDPLREAWAEWFANAKLEELIRYAEIKRRAEHEAAEQKRYGAQPEEPK